LNLTQPKSLKQKKASGPKFNATIYLISLAAFHNPIWKES
jgi:hypothetical protein